MRRRFLVIIAIALLAIVPPAYNRLLTSPVVYLPLVLREHQVPDSRFGIAEHTPQEAALLGLADADYISGQWRLPLEGDTAVFFRPAERASSYTTWMLCSWVVADDNWYDEAGCREWIQTHPGLVYIIGNELGAPAELGGDGDWIDATQYARWYHEARLLIKSEDSTAVVAPYGPMGQSAAGLLLAVWGAHLEQYGTPLEADFQPVHHYCHAGDGPEWCWTKLVHWIGWLESHRGTYWVGPRDYWPLEWGLPAWSHPVPLWASLELMAGMIFFFKDNDVGISQHAWWGACNAGWPNACTLLIRNSQVTELGHLYLKLALE